MKKSKKKNIKPKKKKNNEECNNSYTHTQNRITNDMIYLERNSYTIKMKCIYIYHLKNLQPPPTTH